MRSANTSERIQNANKSGTSEHEYRKPYDEVIESDKNHDFLFEEYLNSRGWKSKHVCLDDDNDVDTSVNTSGSYHGDNIRYNLFPDSSDRIDSFDAEVDRLSDLSFRSTETRNEHQYTEYMGYRNQGVLPYNISEEEEELEGGNSEEIGMPIDEYDNSGFVIVSNSNVIENAVHELPFSNMRTFYKHGTNHSYPIRENKFTYTQTDDSNRTFLRKIPQCTKVSKSNTQSGIPLNAKDNLVNYCRKNAGDVNYTNLDRILESKDPAFTVSNQPCQKFPPNTTLDIKCNSQCMLIIPDIGSFGISGYFRSNLATVYMKERTQMLIVATGSRVNFFDFTSFEPNSTTPKFIGWIHLKFQTTTMEQVRNSVNPYEPYSINYLTVKKYKEADSEYDVLTVSNDFSQVIILNMYDIVEHMFSKQELTPEEEEDLFTSFDYDDERLLFECKCVNNRIPLFESKFYQINKPLELSSSAWCVDINGCAVVVSDNSRTVSVFIGGDLKAKSPVLSHNIPYLSTFSKAGNSDEFYITCGTYRGHIYTLNYNYIYETLVVCDTIEAEFPVWSTNVFHHDDFLEVNSMKELTGDLVSDLDGDKVDKIITQSKVLEADSDPKYSAHFGLAAYFTHLTVPSITNRHYQKKMNHKTLALHENNQLERIRKLYDEWYMAYSRPYDESKIEKSLICSTKCNSDDKLADYYIAATTAHSIGLFSFKELINLATCKTVFPIIDKPFILERSDNNIPNDTEFVSYRTRTNREEPILPSGFEFLNRVYLSFKIPELNAIVVATQAGQVAIFRMTHYHGLHSMRLEWLLMDTERYSMARGGSVRSIIGLSAHPSGLGPDGGKQWTIVVVCSDLLVLRYNVCKHAENKMSKELQTFLGYWDCSDSG